MLTALDLEILTIEAATWRYHGGKAEAIGTRTGLTHTGYYQHLNRLLDNPAAQAHDPVTVNRLRRWRDDHRTQVAS